MDWRNATRYSQITDPTVRALLGNYLSMDQLLLAQRGEDFAIVDAIRDMANTDGIDDAIARQQEDLLSAQRAEAKTDAEILRRLNEEAEVDAFELADMAEREADALAIANADIKMWNEAFLSGVDPTDIRLPGDIRTTDTTSNRKKDSGLGNMSEKGQQALSMGVKIGSAALDAVDDAFMGDKNFDAQSLAVDALADTAANMASLFGPWGCVCAGTRVITNDGRFVNIEDLTKDDGIVGFDGKKFVQQTIFAFQPPAKKPCVEIIMENGDTLRCSEDHPIYCANSGRALRFTINNVRYRVKLYKFVKAVDLKPGDHIGKITEVPIFGNNNVIDAYLLGLLIGDGTYGKNSGITIFSANKSTWEFLEANYNVKSVDVEKNKLKYNSEFRTYRIYDKINLLKEHGIYGQTKLNKTLPIGIHTFNKQSLANLLAGLYDTDGCISYNENKPKNSRICFALKNLNLIKHIKEQLLKFGIHAFIGKQKAKKHVYKGHVINSSDCYTLNIKDKLSIINFYNNIHLHIDYKQEHLTKLYNYKLSHNSRDNSELANCKSSKVKSIIPIGVLQIYNLQADDSHTYIANGIITHNTVAAGAIKVANFTSKAVGQTTQGFDVDINSSGYGQLGHMEDKSNRDFGAMIGLGGLNPGKIDRQLANRNYLAQMALKASNVADTTRFEQEARMNAVDDVVRNNQIALAGGVDTSLLAAKQGAVLERKNPFKAIELDFVSRITKAQNGAKLENVEVSDTPSVIPSGDLHKNKHDDFGIDVTKKGIPIITVDDDNVSTLPEIQMQADSVVQHAEVETGEVIFSKSLTDFVENLRKKWHQSDRKNNELCLEAGMRICKELIENTEDNTDITAKQLENLE